MKKKFLIILVSFISIVGIDLHGAGGMFQAARPVWPKGYEAALNFSCRFRGEFTVGSQTGCTLRITSAYPYRVRVNGRFAWYGPARAAPGFFRMDELNLATTCGVNRIEVDAYAGNNECFYFPRQKPFLQAEVLVGSDVVLATGRNLSAFTTERVRKVPRFSDQRHFVEVYRLPFFETSLELSEQVDKRILPREYAQPTFKVDHSYRAVSFERVRCDETLEFKDKLVEGAPNEPAGNHFPKSELEENPYYDVRRMVTSRRRPATAAERMADRFRLSDGQAVTFEGEVNRSGFACFQVSCEQPCRVYFTFDEILQSDGFIDITRIHCANTAEWIFERSGKYDVELFEPNAFKCARALVVGGLAEVTVPCVRAYESPIVYRGTFKCSDRRLERLFAAAQLTLAANGVDCLTDCPTRERAGWCGDTYFTGKACSVLTGDGQLEKLFLSNWLMPERFDAPEDRMHLLPAVYPANLGYTRDTYIPNFSLWFILQVEDYARRTGDVEFAKAFRRRLEDVLSFFRKYENADGLLENLPFWVFVGWSRASELVQNVSYVSNMQYAAALDSMARMYDCADLATKARRVRAKVREQSWTGEWFCDNAVRQEDGTLKLSGECTETCQYYAMFCGVAPRMEFPVLWARMIRDFGPGRDVKKTHPQIAPSNFIFGRCLREELLSAVGERRRVYDEMCQHFLGMAEKTGTLWEHNEQGTCCSCCHGLASIAAVYLVRDVLGVRNVNPVAKSISFVPDALIPLDYCAADIPVSATELAHVGWRRENGKIKETITIPTGWRIVRCDRLE